MNTQKVSHDDEALRNSVVDATAGQLLTVPEAARLLKVSTSTIWRWINRGELPAYRAGQRRIVLKATEIQHILTAGRQRHGEGGSTMPEPVIPLSPLTPTDVARLQAAMAQAQAIRARILQERHGRLLPSSTELLREQREQRSAQL